VQAKIALRDEAVTAADFALGLFCALFERDGCPEGSGIRLHPDQTQADDVPDLRRVVIERGGLVHVIDQRFLMTVIEKIAERQPRAEWSSNRAEPVSSVMFANVPLHKL